MRASVRFITVIILQLLFVEFSSVWATPSNAHSPSMDSTSQNHTFYQFAEATPSPSSNCNPLQPIHTNCQYAPSIHEDTHDSHHLSILPNASAPAPTNTQFPHTQHLTQSTNTVTNYSNTNHNTSDSQPLNHSQAPTSKDSENHQSHPDFDRFVNADSAHFAHHPNDLHTKSIKIAFYNVENLFDTIRNPLTYDAEFTPRGVHRWDTERYRHKISHIAQVLDELQADIIGLAEIENEEVLQDLLLTMNQDYNYIHRHTADSRGIDVALLYRGSNFIPQRISQAGSPLVHRDFLIVEGELNNEPLCLVICHMPAVPNGTTLRNRAAQLLHQITDSLSHREPNRKLIVMGDFNATPSSAIGKTILGHNLFTPFIESERRGFGSYCYRDRRLQYDFIIMSRNLALPQNSRTENSTSPTGELTFSGRYGIFVREYLLQRDGAKRGYPLRTFDGNTYTGGYSDHLPVWIELTQPLPSRIEPATNHFPLQNQKRSSANR